MSLSVSVGNTPNWIRVMNVFVNITLYEFIATALMIPGYQRPSNEQFGGIKLHPIEIGVATMVICWIVSFLHPIAISFVGCFYKKIDSRQKGGFLAKLLILTSFFILNLIMTSILLLRLQALAV